MAVAAVALILVAGMWSAYQQHEAGKEAKKGKEYEAAMEERQAATARITSRIAAEDAREDARVLLGAQRARMAAAGVQISQGSPLALFVDTRVKGERDAQRILWLGEEEAQTYKYNAKLLRYEGSVLKTQASRAVFGSLLGSSGQAAGTYYSSQRSSS